MIEVAIPGYKSVEIKHAVLDYNGTIACDGKILKGVREAFEILSDKLQIYIVTADTFGKAKNELSNMPVSLSVLSQSNQAGKKLDYINNLGAEFTVCIGNGRNDRKMLKKAVIGIALIQEEGASVDTLLAADIICKDILSALKLLVNTKRLIATLRS